jgi:hypothetical protein
MGTGVGEAALIGAAVGGGTALLTGNDPLRGALLGGITGGAGSKLGSVFGGATGAKVGAVGSGAGGAGGTGAAVKSFSESLNPSLTSVGSSGTDALANSLNAAQIPATTINTGIAGAIPNQGLTGLGGMQNIGATQGAGIASAVPQVAADMSSQGIRNLGNSLYNTSGQVVNPTGVGSAVDNYTGQLTTNFSTSPQNIASATQQTAEPGFFDNLMNKYEALSPGQQTATKIGLGIAGGVGLNALTGGMNQPRIKALKEEENPFGLATYDREKYTSVNPLQHNVYRPVYGAEGGIMDSYAQGGITALAQGGMGQNQYYPMGQMDMTQYATPSQMPTSAEIVTADYDQAVHPYTGTPLKMAEGGEVKHMAMGGLGGYYGMNGQYNQPNYSIFGMNRFGRNIAPPPPTPDAVKAYEAYINQTAMPAIYDTDYQDYIEGTPMVTTPEEFAPAPSFIDAYNLLAATSPNIASTISPGALAAATGSAEGMASGGIAGYNLGGYASGGNPRLLKGPGDGMSDNIPATIGGRQPARLADGEFVVPADVVSHLGNGSTDAGAKHLYKMMDKVRKARTGNKKQGKQIKPGKFLPA